MSDLKQLKSAFNGVKRQKERQDESGNVVICANLFRANYDLERTVEIAHVEEMHDQT